MDGHTLMKRGLCPDCGTGHLAHGPWTDEQIAEVAADVGIPISDFSDACDVCFVQLMHGDAAYAQSLVPDRPLQLPPAMLRKKSLMERLAGRSL